ncbi:MAG: NADPH-dependent assimilatory sulfite reductase hemoprotein subunit, partial [Planctomycetota bacterium]
MRERGNAVMTGEVNGKEKKESKVEVAKRNSRHLRGTIAETLAEDVTHFGSDDVQVLKFHGVYQQDDRDVRHERRKAGQEEAYQFMVRCAIPGGVLTAEQYLNLDELADRYAHGSLRATSRQGFQFHGVIKSDLKATIAGINARLLTTLSACGDVERNVMACAAPVADEAHTLLRTFAREVAAQLRPASRAYHEIWLNGEKTVSTADEEPFYGDRYLPRKFKTGFTLQGDNCIDVYT